MELFLHRLLGLSHWQIDGVITILLLQGAVFAPIPEEVIIVSVGILWSQGKIGYFEGLFAVQFGLLPANALLVWAGNFFGNSLINHSLRPLRGLRDG